MSLKTWDQKGGFKELLASNNLPLISAYCGVNLTDASKRKEEVDKIVRWAKIVKSYGGTTAVVGPNGVKRPSYDFNASKADIIASLNEIGRALTDIGIIGALHQHTGTCIELRDEVYAVLDAMDTKVHALRTRRGPVSQRRLRPGQGRQGFSSLDPARPLKRLGRRYALAAVLPAGKGESGPTGHP